MITRQIETMPKIKNGEPFVVPRKGALAEFIHTCCDCGARHDVIATVGSRNVVFRFWRLAKRGVKQ